MRQEWKSLIRKVVYFVIIAALLVPLAMISRPATNKSPGGMLAQLRQQHQLAQANLGEIDPASETIRLASLGMTGIAANILWEKANHYKLVEDWTSFKTTLDQITRVQPNFAAVWRFQAWNLSYNVSAEFDDYKDRYYWVKQGIEYIQRGTLFNRDHPKLLWDVGWFICQKIGRADERKQFRRLFKNDEDFHGARARTEDFDNWLVGKEWFLRAQEAVARGSSLRGMSPLIFYADAPMSQINYSANLNEDGRFGEFAKAAWAQSAEEWLAYGNMNTPTSYGFDIRLNEREALEEQAQELRDKLEALAPGLRQRLIDQKRATLTAAQREALDLPVSERVGDQHIRASEAREITEVTHREVAGHIEGEDGIQALRIANQLEDIEESARVTQRYRDIVNFDYWRARCLMERTDDALLARELVHEGAEKRASGDPNGAKESYAEGLKYWKKVLDEFPSMLDDRTTGEDLSKVIEQYREILDQVEEPFPEDFPLQNVIDRYPPKPY